MSARGSATDMRSNNRYRGTAKRREGRRVTNAENPSTEAHQTAPTVHPPNTPARGETARKSAYPPAVRMRMGARAGEAASPTAIATARPGTTPSRAVANRENKRDSKRDNSTRKKAPEARESEGKYRPLADKTSMHKKPSVPISANARNRARTLPTPPSRKRTRRRLLRSSRTGVSRRGEAEKSRVRPASPKQETKSRVQRGQATIKNSVPRRS